MKRAAYYFVNSLSIYRLIAAPVLVALVFTGHVTLFSWLLPVSFLTDVMDGFFARKLKVESKFGSKMDSIADDATLLAAIIAAVVVKPDFVRENLVFIIPMIVLVIAQNALAFWRYGKMSSYHTYAAKMAMVLQGSFLILLFLLDEVPYWLFYPAAIVTLFDLAEEIVLVFLLPKWETNVKGLWWVLKRKRFQSVH